MNELLQMGVKHPTELAHKEDIYFYLPQYPVFNKSLSTLRTIV